MAKLKTAVEIEQERLDFVRRISGNYSLPTDRLALLYVRQSSIKQVRNNIYSGLQQTEDMLDRAIALGWDREQLTIFIENNMARDGKVRGVSGTIPIEDRPGLKTIIEYVKRGAGAILCVDVSRLTRDADLVDAANLAQTCKKHHAVIVTSEHVYDFRKDGELDFFMNEAKEAANYIKKQVGSKEYPNGKMYRGRNKKADKGKLANGVAPIGLMRDETGDNLKPSPHSRRVDWLYGRFRALDANLAGLFHEIVGMTKRGEVLFPDSDEIDPSTVYLKRIDGGWTVASLRGLKYILSNPMYAGHLVYNGRIVKRDAHPAIVNADNWEYAFSKLASVDLDGQTIEREARAVRYAQQGSTNTALLAGARDDGRLVIDGTNGAHVYVNVTNNIYIIRKHNVLSTTGYKASIAINELDRLIEERVLHWCRLVEQAPHIAMGAVEQAEQPITTVEEDSLERARQELAMVQRALATSQDTMSDERLRETFAKEARLIARIAKLEQGQKDADRQARELEKAKSDIEQACDMWGKWSLEKRRSFVRLVTDSITLEEITSGWLRLTITWSLLMGFVSPLTSSTRAVDTLYLWRPSGNVWTEDEKSRLRETYPTAISDDILHALPSRTWLAIVQKAVRMGISRTASNDVPSIPVNMSLTDRYMLKEFAIEPGKRAQWQHGYTQHQVTNDASRS